MIGKLNTRKQQTRIALLIWIIVTVSICVYGEVTGWSRSVTGAYAEGAQGWIDSVNVYAESESELHGFLYLPQAAMIWVPLAPLPTDLANIIWRVFAIGLFAFGAWRFYRVAEELAGGPMILLMTILTIPAALSTMRNGQSTLPMTGSMLLGSAALMSGHWWRGAIWLVIAIAFKPPAVALLLVAWVVYPALWWRVPIVLVGFVLLPFLAQRPTFVIDFYAGFLDKALNKVQPSLSGEADTFFAADIAALIRTIGVDLSERAALLIRAVAGLATLGLSGIALRRFGLTRGTLLVASWGLTYVVLFNPATENNSYAAIAPIMAIFAVMSMEAGRPWLGTALAALPILIAINYETTKHITPGHTEWLCAVVTILFFVYLTLVTIGTIRPPWRSGRDAVPAEAEVDPG